MEIILHDRETDVMQVLWDRGSATVAEVRDALRDELAYTTVLTFLRILEEKGYVRHEEEGRAHRYFPLIEPRVAQEGAIGRLTRKLFRDSPELLLTHIVSDRRLSREQLQRIRELLDERLGEEDGR
jgi:BlaI family transcriptional regulator, penicillinase repressor